MLSVFQNNDFVLFTETWAGEFSDLSVDGFTLVHLNRTERKQSAKRNSGGVALHIRDSYYKYCTVLEKSGDDIICIKIDKGIPATQEPATETFHIITRRPGNPATRQLGDPAKHVIESREPVYYGPYGVLGSFVFGLIHQR